MHLSALVDDGLAVDVIETPDTIYVVTRDPKAVGPIYSDRRIEYVTPEELLRSENLARILTGKSVLDGTKPLEANILYEYDLTGLSRTDKQRFSHAVSGTGGRTSILEELGGRRVGRGAIIVPAHAEQDMDEHLEGFGIPAQKTTVLLEVGR